MAAVRVAPPRPSSKPRVPRERRLDIEGLRAVAVLGVLAFHAGLPFVPGGYVGVDVFFVISGFLITGLVAAEVASTGRLSFSRFYARRIKRLLPASALVLVVTAVASFFVLSPLALRTAGVDISSAALYVSNWHFALQQTDYLATETNPSPVLHYWSLSVEEQYYVLWPLLLIATAWFGRRRLGITKALYVAVGGVGVVSLVWSLLWTSSNPSYAFFGTMTRAWELALGGVLALAATTVARVGVPVRAVVGWAGLGAVLWSMLVFTKDVQFPGTAALVPALGTAAVLAAGLPRSSTSGPDGLEVVTGRSVVRPEVLLGVGPMRAIGRASYSLYLWHWPPLVLVPVALGVELTPTLGVLIVLLASIPAVLAYRYVEEPFRHSAVLVTFPRRAFGLAAVLTAAGVLAGLGVAWGAPATTIQVSRTTADGRVEQVTIDPEFARHDLAGGYRNGCNADFDKTVPARCVFADETSSRRVALLGDSHAIQWFPALVHIAKTEGWALELDTKSACHPSDSVQYEENMGGAYTECVDWRSALLRGWEDDPSTRPDVVVLAGRNYQDIDVDGAPLSKRESLTSLRDGMVRLLQRLEDMGIRPVVIGDTLAPGFDVPECLAQHPDDVDRCGFNADDARYWLTVDASAAEIVGVPVIDVTPSMCPDGRCPAVINGIIVFRDDHHITATFARSMSDEVKRQLKATPVWATLQGG